MAKQKFLQAFLAVEYLLTQRLHRPVIVGHQICVSDISLKVPRSVWPLRVRSCQIPGSPPCLSLCHQSVRCFSKTRIRPALSRLPSVPNKACHPFRSVPVGPLHGSKVPSEPVGQQGPPESSTEKSKTHLFFCYNKGTKVVEVVTKLLFSPLQLLWAFSVLHRRKVVSDR